MSFDTNGGLGLPEEDLQALDDLAFAQEWKQRSNDLALQMFTDIARWTRTRYFIKPRQAEDHWIDIRGRVNPKLSTSKGKSVNVFNLIAMCSDAARSLIAGHKPVPFTIDIPATNAGKPSEIFRADAAQAVLWDEIEHSRLLYQFPDLASSVYDYGIGYLISTIVPGKGDDPSRMKTYVPTWPGQIQPIYGSDVYGGGESLHGCIIIENMSIDAAEIEYPGMEFVGFQPADLVLAQSGLPLSQGRPMHIVTVLKIWHRWLDENDEVQIGYAEVPTMPATDKDGKEVPVLKREDKTEYPCVPVRFATRRQSADEYPHQSWGALENAQSINAELNQTMGEVRDALLRANTPRYLAYGFNSSNLPKFGPDNNMLALLPNQKIVPLVENFQAQTGDSYLNRIVGLLLSSAGMSRTILDGMPGADTSGAALDGMIHASLSRIEMMRTAIQYCMVSSFEDIWLPLLRKFGPKGTEVLFEQIHRVDMFFPDITPKDNQRYITSVLDRYRADLLSRTRAMQLTGVENPSEEILQIQREKQDAITNPIDVRETAQAQQMVNASQQPQGQGGPAQKIVLSGKLTPDQELALAQKGGFAPQAPQGGAPAAPAGRADAMAKMAAQSQDARMKLAAGRTPTRTVEDNARPLPGSVENASQGLNNQRRMP